MAYSPTSALMPDYDSYAKSQSNILDSYSPTTVLSKLGDPLLYIVRHGEVSQDKKHLIRGLVNPSLNDKGKSDAEKLVEFFAEIPLSAIYVDDLKRTSETIQPLAESKGLEPKTDLRLRSWDVGTDLENKPIEDNEDYVLQLRSNPEQVPVGGQSWGSFTDQTNSAFRDHVSEAMSAPAPVCLVTHGSFIQVIWKELGEEVSQEYCEIPIEPCGVAAIYLTRDGFKPKIMEGEGENADE